MEKITKPLMILPILIFLITGEVKAQPGHNYSTLRINPRFNFPVEMYIDGNRGFYQNRHFNFPGLPGGWHLMKVYAGNSGRAIYIEKIFITPGFEIWGTLYQGHRFRVDRRSPIVRRPSCNCTRHCEHIPGGRYNYRRNGKWDRGYGNNQWDQDYDNDPYYQQDRRGQYGHRNNFSQDPYTSGSYDPYFLHPQEFSMVKSTIAAQSFSSTKMSIAKQALKGKNLSPQQAIEIVGLFPFEQDRFEIATYIYQNTQYRDNYYLVANAFTFSSTKEDYAKYIHTF